MSETQTPPAPGTPPPATPPAVVPPKPGDTQPGVTTPPATPPAGGTPPAGQTGDTGKPPAAPETYDLKAPKDSLLNDAAIDQIKSFAKEKNLTLDQAQALLERENANVASYVELQKAESEKQRSYWLESAKADKEIGGDGFNANAELAKRVVDKFGTDDFKKALDETGLGNHPELVRILARIGKAMGNDTLVVPGASSGTPKPSMAERLYPTPASQ